MLWIVDEWIVLPVIVAIFFIFIETGFRLGRRHADHNDESTRSHIGALQAALLGLLALLLGFTFSMAVSRFDSRKSLVLEEANAIGTASLRAMFLPVPQRQEVAAMIKSYVAARLAFYEAGNDAIRLEASYAEASRIQEQLWRASVVLARDDNRSMALALFTQSLNDVIDLGEKRRAAFENHVPETVIFLLIAVSVIALAFIAYSGGLAGRRRIGSTATFAILIALVLAIILDLDRPRRGLIQVGQESMLRLKADIERQRP